MIFFLQNWKLVIKSNLHNIICIPTRRKPPVCSHFETARFLCESHRRKNNYKTWFRSAFWRAMHHVVQFSKQRTAAGPKAGEHGYEIIPSVGMLWNSLILECQQANENTSKDCVWSQNCKPTRGILYSPKNGISTCTQEYTRKAASRRVRLAKYI